MSDEWDGKVVMSTPGGPIVTMSLGDLLARKDAEIERLRENVDRAGKEAERADRLRAEIARVKADERKNRAEIKRLRAEIDGLEAELALMKSGFEIAYRAMGDKP